MISILRMMLVCFTVSLPVWAQSANTTPASSEAPPVKALRALYDADQGFRDTLDRALANVRDPDGPMANPWKGKTLDDLAAFFNDWFYLLPVNGGADDEFEYIKKFAWFYYRNEYGQRLVGQEPGLGWTKNFVAARGAFLDSQASTASIRQWMADPGIAMDQYVVPPGGFQSFNEFFARDLKPGMRPIASLMDDAVLVAPTDCVLNMIDPLTPEARVAAKLGQKMDVKALLAGSAYAKHFEKGTSISCILLPHTYHHYHAVASGRVVESREDVAGAYWGIPDLHGFLNKGNIGYGQGYSVFEHFRRGYFIIETSDYGYVAMVPVGLDTVGSVVFEDKFRQVAPFRPVPVAKGERMGHFAYGGSLVITLVEQGMEGITIPQGQQMGVLRPKTPPAATGGPYFEVLPDPTNR